MTKSESSLQKAFLIGEKVRHNFDWPNVQEVLIKVKEELLELEQSLSLNQAEQIHELGDLLFTIAQVARHLKINPDDALDLCNKRHQNRMATMRMLAEADGLDYDSLLLETLESYWNKAKPLTKPEEKKSIEEYLQNKP